MSTAQQTGQGRRLIFRETGKPGEVLEVDRFDLDEPAEGEVLVKILAAPINPADLNTIEGTYGVKPPLPATPGIEGFGVVEKSGSADFQTGDRVIFLYRAGTWATHTTVKAEVLFKVPAEIDPLQAAMLKVNPATAWRLLHDFGTLGGDDWVVQNAGNSAVSRCVIQLARDLGIRLISFVRKTDQIPELQKLGAEHVYLDDAEGHAAAKNLLGGENAAVAFNSVGGDSALALMKLLRENGTHVTYGAMGRRPLTVPNGLLIFRNLNIRGLWVTKWLEHAETGEVHALYQNLAERVTAGKIVQPVDSTHALEHFQHALDRLEAADRDGKVLFSGI
jgi:mitochondrial enoyl-[acyl-carrier protein] reductase / trans-2-enoyl-CoA reductase